MIVRLHRWQPKTNRYMTQALNLEEIGFLSLFVGERLKPEPGDRALRTQRIDRLQVNPADSTVDVYMSPIVERKYEHPGSKMISITKKTSKKMCGCYHLVENHGASGICLIPGCNCKAITPAKKVVLK